MDFLQNLSLEVVFVGASILILISVLASKLSDRFSIPALALFLVIGMLAGSEGIGGIWFDNAGMAKSIGIMALAFILFSGALDTDRDALGSSFREGILLSTVGILLTAGLVGLFAVHVLKTSWVEGLLLGSIVSSTDAAAVFSILRSKNITLRGRLKPLLEFESGSNDPMAVFLTVFFLQILQAPSFSPLQMVWFLIQQGLIGTAVGLAMARIIAFTVNRAKLEYEGLYPALTFALVMFTYGAASIFGGNGFLAVFVAGFILSKQPFLYRKHIGRFHDGVAWLMQIAMFLTLGLLVFPSKLAQVAPAGLATAAVLMFIARPLAVFLTLSFSRMSMREKTMIAWVGLRGAAPIVLATFPLLAGIPKSDLIFHLVFFVVLFSVLVQGTTIANVAAWLRVDAPWRKRRAAPIELESAESVDAELVEFIVPFGGEAVGKAVYELNLPEGSLVILICRAEKFIVVRGSTVLEEGDVVFALVTQKSLPEFREILNLKKSKDT